MTENVTGGFTIANSLQRYRPFSDGWPADRCKPPLIKNVGSENLPEVTVAESQLAVRKLKNERAPGEHNVIPEMHKAARDKLYSALATLFTKCLIEGAVPSSWNNAIMKLIRKKGVLKKLDNYRPISLLSHNLQAL
ncbi:unnamed protein product [Pieris macdunnoughi]|uniref:Reverse transcriptase n=1 Tax=Pieris macdunnoughi TaxID=345717 RepID=A0A821VZA9_9NEOP|nr:unnamed protein product [Pieris macdunnoughi]